MLLESSKTFVLVHILGTGYTNKVQAFFMVIIIFSPGARFSKVPIINGPIKLFWFTCKIGDLSSFASNMIKLLRS